MKRRSLGWKSFFAAVVSAVIAFESALAGALPSGYVQLPYIESDGTAYINTGVKQSADAVVRLEVSFASLPASGWWSYFGARSVSDGEDQFGAWIAYKNGIVYHYKGVNASQGTSTLIAETFTGYDVVLRKVGECTVNGEILDTGNSATGGSLDYYLFAINQAGSVNYQSKARIYSCEIAYGDEVKRTFVPCRNPDGELGMYDTANDYASPAEGFFGNVAETGNFLYSDEEPGDRLTYIESDGGQWIDTGLKQDANAVAEMRLQFPALPTATSGAGQYWAYFGARSGDKEDQFGAWIVNKDGIAYHSKGVNATLSRSTTLTAEAYVDYDVVLRKVGECTVNGELLDTGNCATGGSLDYYLFAINQAGSARYQSEARVYYCRISYGDELQREFVPFRTEAGEIGLFDLKRKTFHSNKGIGTFAFGAAFDTEGETIHFHDGRIESADVAGYAEVSKITTGTLEAGRVTNYPAALTLAEGMFSLQDGVARAVQIAGALKLAGGATLRVDVTAQGCDCLNVQTLDLSGASATNPFMLNVAPRYDEDCCKDWMTVIKLPPSNAADINDAASKFSWSGEPVVLRVVDGELQMKLKSDFLPVGYTALPYIESDGTAYINTGVKQSKDAVVRLEVLFASLPPATGYWAYFGARTGDKANQFGAWIVDKNGVAYHCKGVNATLLRSTTLTAEAFVDYDVVLRKVGECTVNGEILDTGNSATGGSLDYYLFAINQAEVAKFQSKARIYSCEIAYGDVVQRNFVPCRNPDGEFGMFDIANVHEHSADGFYGNAAASGGFSCDVAGDQLWYLESDGAAYIDTDVKQDANAVAEMLIQFPSLPSEDEKWCYFGARKYADPDEWFSARLQNVAGTVYHHDGVSKNSPVLKDLGPVGVDVDYNVVLRKGLNEDCTINGQVFATGNGVQLNSFSYYLFALNDGGSVGFNSKARLFSCRISYGDEIQGDFVPFCRWDGALGLLDRKNMKFFANKGSGSFSRMDSHADGMTLKVSRGTLLDRDVVSYDAIEKVGEGTEVQVSRVHSLKSLSVDEGGITMANDGLLTQVPVTGTLSLKGGTSISVDVTADGCDGFSPSGTVDLSGASAANPVRLVVKLAKDFQIGVDDTYTLISSGLQPGDEKKFALEIEQRRIRLVVENGALKAFREQGLIIMVR